MKEMLLFAADQILLVERYVQHLKAELKSTIKITEKLIKLIKECSQIKGETLKAGTLRFESLFHTNSIFLFFVILMSQMFEYFNVM